jgi:hypothetical protein
MKRKNLRKLLKTIKKRYHKIKFQLMMKHLINKNQKQLAKDKNKKIIFQLNYSKA